MMAGAVAADGGASDPHVSAYVVLADGPKSRLFKIGGTKAKPTVEELDAATTLDLKRFQEDVKTDLAAHGPSRPADAGWACDVVRVHVRADLGV
jgi:hypothetical protein